MSEQNIEHGVSVAQRVRLLRERYGLSQRELARRSHVTNATISQVEQESVSPTVASLKKIAAGLGMTLTEFFTFDVHLSGQVFYRADELREIGADGVSLRLVAADDSSRRLQVLHETYAPGTDTGAELLQHEGEESGIVVKGRITVTVGAATRVLGPGDAFYFPSRLPHRFHNEGDEPVELVSVSTPPTF